MAEEGLLIALVGSAVPRDDEGDRVDDPAREARIRTACRELGRALAGAGCRLIVYSSDPDFIEADVVAGYAETATTPRSIRFVRPADDQQNFAEQNDDRTKRLFEVQRHDSQDWEVSFYRSLEHAAGVLLVCGGSSTLVAGHVAMILGRPIAPIGAFGGMARKLRNHLVRAASNLGSVEQQALSEFAGDDDAAAVVAGLTRRCEEVAAARRRQAEEAEAVSRQQADETRRLAAALQGAEQELAQLREPVAKRRRALGGVAGFGGISLLLLLIGLAARPPGLLAYGLVLGLPIVSGGFGACLRLVRSGEGDPLTAMVLGPSAGALCGLTYMIPHWTSDAAFFELGQLRGLWLVMLLLVAFGGGLAADTVIDSLRRVAEKNAGEIKLPSVADAAAGAGAGAAPAAATVAAGAAPAADGAAPAAVAAPAGAARNGRKQSGARARNGR